jgi:hypothetical protein
LAGTIVDGTGFVNSGKRGWLRLKSAGKRLIISEILSMLAVDPPLALNQKRRICALPEICC